MQVSKTATPFFTHHNKRTRNKIGATPQSTKLFAVVTEQARINNIKIVKRHDIGCPFFVIGSKIPKKCSNISEQNFIKG